jgi:type II secretory pathway pseudopilin PulG
MHRTPFAPFGRSGRSGAIFAIVVVVAIIGGLGFVSVRSLLKDRRDQNERTAISSIRALNTALYLHRQKHADSYPKSLKEMADVDTQFKCGEAECAHWGYRYKYELLPSNNMGPRYVIQVRPIKYQNTGEQSFYSDESGVIHATPDNRPASAGDGPVS